MEWKFLDGAPLRVQEFPQSHFISYFRLNDISDYFRLSECGGAQLLRLLRRLTGIHILVVPCWKQAGIRLIVILWKPFEKLPIRVRIQHCQKKRMGVMRLRAGLRVCLGPRQLRDHRNLMVACFYSIDIKIFRVLKWKVIRKVIRSRPRLYRVKQ